MKKIVGLLISFTLLTGCAESLALLGPTTTAVGSGNVAQSAFTSAVSFGIKKQTGKSPSEHAVAYVKKHNPENKKDKCIEFLCENKLLAGLFCCRLLCVSLNTAVFLVFSWIFHISIVYNKDAFWENYIFLPLGVPLAIAPGRWGLVFRRIWIFIKIVYSYCI